MRASLRGLLAAPAHPGPDCALAPWAHVTGVPALAGGAVLRVTPGQILAVREATLGGCAAPAVEGPLSHLCVWDVIPRDALPEPGPVLARRRLLHDASTAKKTIYWCPCTMVWSSPPDR